MHPLDLPGTFDFNKFFHKVACSSEYGVHVSGIFYGIYMQGILLYTKDTPGFRVAIVTKRDAKIIKYSLPLKLTNGVKLVDPVPNELINTVQQIIDEVIISHMVYTYNLIPKEQEEQLAKGEEMKKELLKEWT